MSWVPAPEEPVDPGDLAAFAAMFDKHAEHVYDYCRELLGDTEDAAEATEAALIAARSVLQNPEQLRAWLFALARDEVLSRNPEQAEEYGNLAPPEPYAAEDGDLALEAVSPARASGPAAGLEPAGAAALASPDGDDGEPRDAADPVNDSADTDQFAVADIANAGAGGAGVGEVRAPTIVSDLSGREREVLDLVYRHGIRPDHLPAVLGVPPEHALALLSAAEEDFQAAEIRDGAAIEAAAEVGLEQIAAVPLAPLPPSVRRRTFQAVFGVEPRPYAAEPEFADEETPRRGYGEPADAAFGPGPEPMDRARKRLRVAAIVVVPAAAIAGVGFYLSGSPLHQVGNAALNPPASTGSPTGSSGPAAQAHTSRPDPKRAKSKSTSIAAFFPKSPHTVAPPVTDPTQPPVPTPTSTSPTAVITQPPKRHHHPKPSPSSTTVTISPSSPPPSTGTPTPSPTTPTPTPSASSSGTSSARDSPSAGDSPSPAPTSALSSSPAQFFFFPAVIAAPSRGTSPKPTSA